MKGFAEKMEGVEDNTFDAVTCTLVLCTVRSVEKSLEEVQRVLKPVSFHSVIMIVCFDCFCGCLLIYSANMF